MPAARHQDRTIPARPLYSDEPAPAGVYHSLARLGNRWVYYALGVEGAVLGCDVPRWHELDAAVIARMDALVRDEPRMPALVLVSDDALTAAGLDSRVHRSLALPRPVRPPVARRGPFPPR